MIAKNYVELPAEGIVRGCVQDEGDAVTVYLDIREETEVRHTGAPDIEEAGDGTGRDAETVCVRRGYAVRCAKPVTRGALINSAEMQAYGLRDAMAVASFGASLARKARCEESRAEVEEHDEFINWVKAELDKAGIK